MRKVRSSGSPSGRQREAHETARTMIKSVRVGSHKGFEGGVLTGLGHINVICGRNNSGKSTLLEAIADALAASYRKRSSS